MITVKYAETTKTTIEERCSLFGTGQGSLVQPCKKVLT
jgi:hypothetical protein